MSLMPTMGGYTLLNLTPYLLTLNAGDYQVTIPPHTDTPPRLTLSTERVERVEACVPRASVTGDGHTVEVTNLSVEVPFFSGLRPMVCEPPLPAPTDGVILVVQKEIAEHFPDRTDLAWPTRTVLGYSGRGIAFSALRALRPLGGDRS